MHIEEATPEDPGIVRTPRKAHVDIQKVTTVDPDSLKVDGIEQFPVKVVDSLFQDSPGYFFPSPCKQRQTPTSTNPLEKAKAKRTKYERDIF